MLGDMGSFLLSFAFNFLVAFLVVRFIYYPSTHNKRYIFTFLAFNTLIYFVLSFMNSIEIGIGVGFGLFAIFSILRYRTDPIPIREMTYLFIIAALPVMNSAGSNSEVWWQLVAANGIILVILWVLEKEWGFHYEATKRITYERIELIHPDRRNCWKTWRPAPGCRSSGFPLGKWTSCGTRHPLSSTMMTPPRSTGCTTRIPK